MINNGKLNKEQMDLLDGLWGVFSGRDRVEDARRIEALIEEPLPVVLDALSAIERIPGLDAGAHRLVALCKQALTGKIEEEVFWRAAQRDAGLI